MTRIRLKICRIASIDEARLALDAGADAIGIGDASSPDQALSADSETARIIRRIPPPAASVLLSGAWSAGTVAAQADLSGAGTVQIMRLIDPAEYAGMRRILRGRRFIQVVPVEGSDSIGLARDYAGLADALLLDAGEPDGGRDPDWAVSRRIADAVPVPVLLSGGLTAENVAAAVAAVRPWGVDAGPTLRGPKGLDPARLAAFAQALWG